MTRQIKHIKNSTSKISEKVIRKDFKDNLMLNSEDSDLSGMINEYIKGRLDLEDVWNDPALPGTRTIVSDVVSDYHKKGMRNSDDVKFISDNFTGKYGKTKATDEINGIKSGIDNNEINKITEDWVNEWQGKQQKDERRDKKNEEIRDFITSSLESVKSKPENSRDSKVRIGSMRSPVIRYISVSTAAAIGLFILIRMLFPTYDPDELYSTYYESFSAVSPVTRSVTGNEISDYSAAVEKYKIGDYQTAAIEFSGVMLKDNSAIAPRFFMGITQLALGNYAQAINLLSDVTSQSGEYGKEAEWYLGLAYLKSGEKENAFACFEHLSQTPGFYSKRADKILRRLK